VVAESSGALVTMSGITKRFGGVLACDGVELSVRAGEVRALLGENGAGKSTLMNVLAGVITDHEGTITVAGTPRRFRSPADAQTAGIAMIHQELDLVPGLSVAENIFLGREPRTRLRTLDARRMAVADALLKAHPDANAVYAHNDPMAEGAYLAADAAGRAADLAFTGIDALPIPSGGIKAVEQGRLKATYVYPTGGREAIDLAKKILIDCTEVPKTTTLETQQVTAENAAQVYTQLGGQA
jgi:energy-coupling factor transporter ATP-binding protein EcfA2